MKTQSTHAQAAKLVRQDLKKAFPSVKFSVKSRSYAGGNSIDIQWTNGPTHDNVVKVVGKYEQGTFDAMTDYYNYDNIRNDIPQVKYLLATRDIAQETMMEALEVCKNVYAVFENINFLYDYLPGPYYDNAHQFIRRYLSKVSLSDSPSFEELKEMFHAIDEGEY